MGWEAATRYTTWVNGQARRYAEMCQMLPLSTKSTCSPAGPPGVLVYQLRKNINVSSSGMRSRLVFHSLVAGAFDLHVHISGIATSRRTPELLTRSQRTFLRLAKCTCLVLA